MSETLRERKKRILQNKTNYFNNKKGVLSNLGSIGQFIADDTNNLDNILITCIKKPQEELIITEDIQPHDSKEEQFETYKDSKINKCWNCSYDIQGEIHSYPISYHNNVFQINGNFCSQECSARYIYDEFGDKDFWNKYYLLNLMVRVLLLSN